MFARELDSYVAYNFNCRIETEGFLRSQAVTFTRGRPPSVS